MENRYTVESRAGLIYERVDNYETATSLADYAKYETQEPHLVFDEFTGNLVYSTEGEE